jgi:L-galactose dehydrogenase
VDIADLAMQFALSYEAAAVTLVGMSKANHVARNIAQVGVAPDPELLAAVEQILAPAMDVCWRSGLPAHDDPNAVGAAS